MGSVIRSTHPFYVALDPVSLTLSLLDKQSESITPAIVNQAAAAQIASLRLHGKTMAEGLTWLKQAIAPLGVDADKVVFLEYPPDDFPDHALAYGACFDASQTHALSELAAYYANTHQVLQAVIETTEDASSDRIWPHHFDLATLIMLPVTQNGNPLTVGVGLSPGDTSYAEPYWYVSPYPYPDTANLPAVSGDGFWHTQHWVGAVLPTSRLTQNDSAEAQQQQVESFLHSALKTSILLLIAGSTDEL
ncbi:MAG: hypothetical protein SFY66_27130 [Oculatellaceae cyanobacterium bins.114]|nr:hypothetical protein [Oculatellaceae cyanobacterium bins.114]